MSSSPRLTDLPVTVIMCLSDSAKAKTEQDRQTDRQTDRQIDRGRERDRRRRRWQKIELLCGWLGDSLRRQVKSETRDGAVVSGVS